ncbi:MAG TPA: hypothetical protein HPP57_03890 [Deltaproteobacteria bacterium]|jgi:hypothetical protein|nr:hypothetical protein [Deltaproteobacteria bacterium]
MEITSGHFSAARLFNCPEAFLKGARAVDEEECGYCPDSTYEQRFRIICAYLKVLEEMRGPLGVDSELPCPKEQIREAIFRELADGPDGDLQHWLEIAYVLLESFIPCEEYRVIEDFKAASRLTQQIAEMGNPASILRSAGIIRRVNGESAVRLQEKIHEKMTKRHLEVLKLRENNSA